MTPTTAHLVAVPEIADDTACILGWLARVLELARDAVDEGLHLLAGVAVEPALHAARTLARQAAAADERGLARPLSHATGGSSRRCCSSRCALSTPAQNWDSSGLCGSIRGFRGWRGGQRSAVGRARTRSAAESRSGR